jgi:hypothetical protein
VRQGAGYERTEIWCESSVERRYRVMDVWSSLRDFELFRARFWSELERFHRLLASEGIVSKFEVVGTDYDER